MDKQIPNPDDKLSARRRLLRGSFSVPAVLTLASGSALAAKSATCLAKATATPSTAALMTGTPSDTFVRVQLVAYIESSTTKYALTRASFGSMVVSTSFWASDTVWQQFDDSANGVTGSQQTSAVPSGSTSNKWVALRFNNAGEIVGAGLSGTGSVVGSSCWTSMKMTTP